MFGSRAIAACQSCHWKRRLRRSMPHCQQTDVSSWSSTAPDTLADLGEPVWATAIPSKKDPFLAGMN